MSTKKDQTPLIIKLPDHFYPNLSKKLAVLPQGWKYKLDFRGKIYYINESQKKTTLIHPKRLNTLTDELQLDFIQNGKLPEGWEIFFTKQGNKVYLNHKQRLTQFNDPRKEKKKSKK